MSGLQIWVSANRARELGCTHKARFMGIIPGFFSEDGNLWVSRSDLLIPFEELLSALWVWTRELRGEEPDFMFQIREPL